MAPLDEAERYLDGASLLDRSGAVLYSGVETLRPGPVYLLGLNPGGLAGATLRASLAGSRAGRNCYEDECWAPGDRELGKGQAPLQRRVRHLCQTMKLEPRAVPASNLVFTRSRDVATHGGFEAAIELCLPVHRIFVEAIRPRLLVTFGGFGYFEKAFSVESVEKASALHGTWRARRGRARLGGLNFAFANVPHMSRWGSDSRETVLRWAIAPAGLPA